MIALRRLVAGLLVLTIAIDAVPFIPLGRYLPRAAWSKGLSDPGKGPAPTFWNVSKS